MRYRNHRVVVYFIDVEMQRLNEKVEKSKLSRDAFIRRCVAAKEIKEAPSADFPVLIMALRNSQLLLKKAIRTAATSKGFQTALRKTRDAERQTRFWAKHNIEADSQLHAHRDRAQHQTESLTAECQELRNELRQLKRQNTPDGEAIVVSERISLLSQRIKILRGEVALRTEIEDRTERIRQNLLELRQETERKENKHEYIRRRGGLRRKLP